MRTVKRQTETINAAKRIALEKLVLAYTREKRYWLDLLKSQKYQSQLGAHRQIRDEALKNNYVSSQGLQARHWKLALQDAVETWDKYWEAIFVQARKKIARHIKVENERHYAFWLLVGYKQFTACMAGEAMLPSFPIDLVAAGKICSYVQRTVRRLKGSPPTVKKSRIVKFDANCYEVFEKGNRQYIKLMSLEKGKRIVLPLLGKANITGSLSLLLKKDSIEILVSQEIKSKAMNKTGPVKAVDFGYTEVMTDTENVRYGKNLGSILSKATEDLNQKMIKRNKLHALEKRLRTRDPKTAYKLRKYNLGKHKQQNKLEKVRASVSCEINTAIHQLIRPEKSLIIITEDLSAPFPFNKSKGLNRKLSRWVRGEIQERVVFKALSEGFRHEQVNPAYGSQTCLLCGFVDSKNRKGDVFKCCYCKHEDVADRVAAKNYETRYGDQEIRRDMPPSQVRTILVNRFKRRLETGQPVTVPGTRLDTVQEVCPPPLSKPCYSRKRAISKTGRSLSQRNKTKMRTF